MVATTLDAMAAGGIYDHLGGGFARYATDRPGGAPLREDALRQGRAGAAYLHAWQVTGDARYRQVVEETVGYVLRRPRRSRRRPLLGGGRRLRGRGGQFYVWTPGQVRGGRASRRRRRRVVRGDDGRELGGPLNILRRPLGGDLLRPPAEVEAARARLFDGTPGAGPARASTTRCSPNGTPCSVAALAEAAPPPGDRTGPRRPWRSPSSCFGDAAATPTGGGCGPGRAGEARAPGRMPGDYAWLVECLHPAGRADRARPGGSSAARATADGHARPVRDDGDRARCSRPGRDAEALIVRPKDIFDGAMPSANSVAAVALLRLGALTGDDALHAGRRGHLLGSLEPLLRHVTAGRSPTVLAAADLPVGGVTEVVVAGDRPDLRRRRPPPLRAHGRRWPGASATPSPAVGGPGRRWRPTCAATIPAGCRPTPWQPPSASSTPSSTADRAVARRADAPCRPRRRRHADGRRRDAARAATARAAGAAEPTRTCRSPGGAGTEGDRPRPRRAARRGACRRCRRGSHRAWWSPAPTTTPWPSTWPAGPSSGCGSPGRAAASPTSHPSRWSTSPCADDPERDDLAQPEAVTVGRRARARRHAGRAPGPRGSCAIWWRPPSSTCSASPGLGPLLGVPGHATRRWPWSCPTGPLLVPPARGRLVWARFGWPRSDNWLPVRGPPGRRPAVGGTA